MQIETTYFLYHISSYLSNHDVWSQCLDQTKGKKNMRVHSTQGGCRVVWSGRNGHVRLREKQIGMGAPHDHVTIY